MRLEEYDRAEGRKVWLSKQEVELLLSEVTDMRRSIAIGLGVRCGLRAAEIVAVTPADLATHDTGPRVRVEHGKGDQYREVPLPIALHSSLQAFSQAQGLAPDASIVGRSTRSIERWVSEVANTLRVETNDEGWKYLGPHDLRRTWGTILVAERVEPGLIMSWGGWDNWETFREHYLGAYSPDMERKEMDKVPWL